MHKNVVEYHEYWESQLAIRHISNPTWWIARLDLGVKVFFAISGYILGMPFLKYYLHQGKKIDIKQYFIRRLTRLEPPFIISLLALMFAQIVLQHKNILETIQHFIAGIFYAHYPIYGQANPINPVTWSLETEAQFYITLPLLLAVLFLFKKRSQQLVVFVIMLSAFLWFKHLIYIHQIKHIANSIFYYFPFFAVGTIYAAAHLARPDVFFSGTKKISYDALGLISVFCLFYFYKPQQVVSNTILFNLAVFGLFLSTFRGKLFNWFFTRPIIYLIGGMCYSIYLLHYALFSFIIPHTIQWTPHMGYWPDLLLQILIVFPITLALCGLFFILVEKPCMNKDWPQQLMAKLGLRKKTISD